MAWPKYHLAFPSACIAISPNQPNSSLDDGIHLQKGVQSRVCHLMTRRGAVVAASNTGTATHFLLGIQNFKEISWDQDFKKCFELAVVKHRTAWTIGITHTKRLARNATT
eukprot:689794-Pelagomonas_calceolata.AAC.2